MIRKLFVVCTCLFLLCTLATADTGASVTVSQLSQNAQNSKNSQNSQSLSSGIDFANTLLPTQPGQLVNSNAANAGAWSGANNSAVMPPSMGAFSNPVTSSVLTTYAPSGALSALGEQAQANCATYVPTGDPVSDQYCAAVNFMANQCIQPTQGQSAVIAANAGTPNLFASTLNNCSASYGQGSSQFGFAQTNNGAASDGSNSAQSGSGSALGASILNAALAPLHSSVCVTAPATASETSTNSLLSTSAVRYTTDTCWLTTLMNVQSCTQNLSVTITQSTTPPTVNSSCASGTLVGSVCELVQNSDPVSTLVCPAGFALIAQQCTQTLAAQANSSASCPSEGVWDAGSNECVLSTTVLTNANTSPLSVGACPGGTTLEGNNCTQVLSEPAQVAALSCAAGEVLSGGVCSGTQSISSEAQQELSCSANSVLEGSSCVQNLSTPATPVYVCPANAQLNNQICTTMLATAQSEQLSCTGLGTLTSYKPPSMPYQCYRVQSNLPCAMVAYLDALAYVDTDNSSGQSVCVLGPVLVLACPPNTVLSAGVCLQSVQSVATVGSYTCSVGTLSAENCIDSTITSAQINYTCPVANLDGSFSSAVNTGGTYTCTTTTTLTSQPISTYSCSAGYTLIGAECQMVQSTPALLSYSCTAPATLQGQSCMTVSNTLIQPVITYSCAQGQILSGEQCLQTLLSTPEQQWSCESGYVLSVVGSPLAPLCSMITQTPVQLTQTCPSGAISSSNDQGTVCQQTALSSVWSNNCAALEQSAGAVIER